MIPIRQFLSPEADPTWARRLMVCLVLGVLTLGVEAVGLITANRALWVPAAAAFPLIVVAGVVCQVMVARSLRAARDR